MVGGTPVDSFIAYLMSMRDVRKAGQQIDSFYELIDVLINNAGVHVFSQRVASAPARVVTVASEGARWAGRIDPAHDLTSTTAYSRRGRP